MVNNAKDAGKLSSVQIKNQEKHIEELKKYVNETKKSKEERSKDIFALVLTIIIVAIIVFVFWKVPVLKKFLFP